MAALQRKTGLGKGLGALLQDELRATSNSSSREIGDTQAPSAGSINFIKVEDITVNPFQPRTDFDQNALLELSESIKLQGLIQPITVRQVGKNEYQLISGERRLRAFQTGRYSRDPSICTYS